MGDFKNCVSKTLKKDNSNALVAIIAIIGIVALIATVAVAVVKLSNKYSE